MRNRPQAHSWLVELALFEVLLEVSAISQVAPWDIFFSTFALKKDKELGTGTTSLSIQAVLCCVGVLVVLPTNALVDSECHSRPAQKSLHTQAMVLGVRAQDQLMTWLTLTMISFVQLPILLTACESPLVDWIDTG